MVKIVSAVIVGILGVTVAFPAAELQQDLSDDVDEALPRQAGALAGILGSIGTALVPVFGSLLGPILTNLAQGIASTFNNGLNPTKIDTVPLGEGVEALIVRIPPNSPLFQALAAAQAPASVADESPLSKPKNPLKKLGAVRTSPTDPAPVHADDDADVNADVEAAEPPSPVKRSQLSRTETDHT